MSQQNLSPQNDGRHEKPDYDQLKRETAYQRYAELIADKIASFQKGKANYWLDPEKVTWPKPLYKGSYNGMNALMLMLHSQKEGFKVPVFVSRERLMSLNYQKGPDGRSVNAVDASGQRLPFVHVSKGARSFPVFLSDAVIKHMQSGEAISYRDYVQKSKAEQAEYSVKYTPVIDYVFNVDQTNIPQTRPELYQRLISENQPRLLETDNVSFRFDAVDAVVGMGFWPCSYKREWAGEIFYDVRENAINIPDKLAFLGGNSYYGTLFEKMIVAAMANGVTKHLDVTDGKEHSEYVRRELAAELGSALICQRYGIRKAVEQESLGYRERWIRNLKELPLYTESVMRNIKDTTSRMGVIIDSAQQVIIDREKERADDLREDGQSEGMDVNGDGVVDANDAHYSPDKKQGSSEGHGESEEETRKRGGFRR